MSGARPDGCAWKLRAILGRGRWDAEALRDPARDHVGETLGADDTVLVIGEAGFLEQVRASCGVWRQYTGSAGKITDCQIGVSAACSHGTGMSSSTVRCTGPRPGPTIARGRQRPWRQRCGDGPVPRGQGVRAGRLSPIHQFQSWRGKPPVGGTAQSIGAMLIRWDGNGFRQVTAQRARVSTAGFVVTWLTSTPPNSVTQRQACGRVAR
jgi:hypothetical protein